MVTFSKLKKKTEIQIFAHFKYHPKKIVGEARKSVHILETLNGPKTKKLLSPKHI